MVVSHRVLADWAGDDGGGMYSPWPPLRGGRDSHDLTPTLSWRRGSGLPRPDGHPLTEGDGLTDTGEHR